MTRLKTNTEDSNLHAALTADRQEFVVLDEGERATCGSNRVRSQCGRLPVRRIRGHRMAAEGLSGDQRLLDLRKNGVYSSYTLRNVYSRDGESVLR